MAKKGIPKMRLRPRASAGTAPATPALVIAAKPERPKRHRTATPPLQPSDPEFWTVINEIADPTPIAPAELDAIERYFSAVLDDVFAPSRKTSP